MGVQRGEQSSSSLPSASGLPRTVLSANDDTAHGSATNRKAELHPDVIPDLHPDLYPRTAASLPSWCQCGSCEEEEAEVGSKLSSAGKGGAKGASATKQESPLLQRRQLCCMEVVPVGKYREEGGLVCRLDAYTGIISDGLDERAYQVYRNRIEKRGPAPDTFKLCNNTQKRVLVYACLYQKLAAARGWTEGIAEEVTRGQVQKTLPACLLQAVREQWHD